MENLKDGFKKHIAPLIPLILILLAVRWTLIEPYVVPTGSMEPTLKTGDRLYALKCAYDIRFPFTDWTLFRIADVKKGDVILFRAPQNPSITYVKRAIAVAGDVVEMRDSRLFVNGKEVQRELYAGDSVMYDIDRKSDKELFVEDLAGVKHFMILDTKRYSPDGRSFPAITVPAGAVFAMGDNRDNSHDSRFWGFVPIENLKGRAMFIWFSSWDFRLRPERIGTLIQ